MSDKKLKLYGASWCMKSAALRNYLQGQWIGFEDLDVEENQQAEADVRALYDGELKFPTLVYGDKFLKNPKTKDLENFLKEEGIED